MYRPAQPTFGRCVHGQRGCATASSDWRAVGTCPPVVEYRRQVQVQAAEEFVLLPEGAAVAEMLANHVVMREQVRACGIS